MFKFFKTEKLVNTKTEENVPEVPTREGVLEAEGVSVVEKETMTASSGNIEGVEGLDMEDSSNPDLVYKAPGFEEVQKLFNQDPASFTAEVEGLLGPLLEHDLQNEDPANLNFENDGLGAESVVGLEKLNEGVTDTEAVEGVEDVEVGEINEKEEVSKSGVVGSLNRAGALASGFAVLALAACDVKVETKTEDGGTPETAEKSGNLNKFNVVEQGFGGKREIVDTKGPGKSISQYIKEMLPSGDFENGKIILNEASFKATRYGMLKYDEASNCFYIETMKSPANQGLPAKAFVFYAYAHSQEVVPGTKAKKVWRDYTKDGKGDLRTFDFQAFDKDIEDSVNKADCINRKTGKFDEREFKNRVKAFRDLCYALFNATNEWNRLTPEGRKGLYERDAVPFTRRGNNTHVNKDNKLG